MRIGHSPVCCECIPKNMAVVCQTHATHYHQAHAAAMPSKQTQLPRQLLCLCCTTLCMRNL